MMEADMEIPFEKTKNSFSDFFNKKEENEYWWSRTPQERLDQIERLRRICFGEDAFKAIDKRIFEVVQID